METNFKINITKEFRDHLNSLNTNKKSTVICKLLFLENTGFLGNCKALGNNIFEYRIDTIKDNIKYFIDNNTILFFIKEKNNNEMISLEDYNNEVLKDIKFAKALYNEIYNLYRQTNEEVFFINVLRDILRIQGKQEFKQITGFESNYIENKDNKDKLETLEQLKNNLKFIIQLKSIDYIIKKTKIKKEDIEQILKIKENINLSNLDKLIKFLNKL